MHNLSSRAVAFRAHSAGGARGTVDNVGTDKTMNMMSGGFMANESRQGVEHFEPHGFTAGILPKDDNGVAEASVHFLGGHRSHPVAGVISDRRYKPRNLKPGESFQYDDAGQGTYISRTGMYVMASDMKAQGGPDAGQSTTRFASLRHINQDPQPKRQQGQTQPDQGSHNHAGKSVNMEARCDANGFYVYDGDKIVLKYDKASSTWTFGQDKTVQVKFDPSATRKVSAHGTVDTAGDKDVGQPIENVYGL